MAQWQHFVDGAHAATRSNRNNDTVTWLGFKFH